MMSHWELQIPEKDKSRVDMYRKVFTEKNIPYTVTQSLETNDYVIEIYNLSSQHHEEFKDELVAIYDNWLNT